MRALHFGLRRRSLVCLLSLGLTALSWAAAPAASGVEITSSPQNTAGGFEHNAFHTSDAKGGQAGTVLAWFDLDAGFGAANDWDLGTGVLTAYFNVYSDETLSTLIGTAVATGSVPPAVLSDAIQQDLIVASLTWSFDLGADPGSALYGHLEATYGVEADDTWDGIVTQFADVQYATSPQGRTANTFDGTDLALWGADGTYEGSKLLGGSGGVGGFGTSAVLGVDLVISLPEPTLSGGILLGLAGLVTARRLRSARRSG